MTRYFQYKGRSQATPPDPMTISYPWAWMQPAVSTPKGLLLVKWWCAELTTLGPEDLCSIRGATGAAPGSYYAKFRLQVNAPAVNIASRIGSRDLWLLPPVPETRR